jgi:hypothetical protein
MGRGAYRVISSSRSASQWRTCGRSDPARILEADASETPSCRLIWGQADSFQGWLDLSRTDLPPQSWLTLSLGPRQCLSRKGPPQVKWGVSGVPKEFTQSALLDRDSRSFSQSGESIAYAFLRGLVRSCVSGVDVSESAFADACARSRRASVRSTPRTSASRRTYPNTSAISWRTARRAEGRP